MKTMVVNSCPFLAESITKWLKSKTRFQKTRYFLHSHSALKAARRYKPDLIILDLGIPGIGSPEIIRELRLQPKHPKILVWSEVSDIARIREAIDAGATGFIPQSARKPELQKAIKIVAEGGLYFPPDTTNVLLQPKSSKLTPRENEIAALLRQGMQTKEIAAKLNISPRTVDVHRHSIRGKLG